MKRGRAEIGSSPLESAVTDCRGVGQKTASVLQKIGIVTIGHLMNHLPRTYLDRRNVHPIGSLRLSASVVIQGEITGIRVFRPARRLHITQCVIHDGTGSVKAIWFNQPYMQRALPKGTRVLLSGTVSEYRGFQLNNPDFEVLSDDKQDFIHTLGLIPVYPLTEGIGQKQIRRIIRDAADDILQYVPESLPLRIVRKEGLIPKNEALHKIHFPGSESELKSARKRIAFEELLALQLCIQSSISLSPGIGIAQDAPPRQTRIMDSCLPFSLTSAQKRAIEAVFRQMESPRQMNVLLQGDVGSGKTVVAAHSILKAIENNRQAILMAPTEILAEQHISRLAGLFGGMSVKSALLSGNISKREKKSVLRLLASAEPSLIVGTHALIERKVRIPNAGLIIIDEQHRFGVNQRAALRRKGIAADLMVMTATPIPRTLALALYGGFETITIDEYPQGRQPVETQNIQEQERRQIYRFVENEIAAGRQAYVVCPEITERAGGGNHTISNIDRLHKDYTKTFPKSAIGLLHGKMKPEFREETLRRFRKNEIQILIATTIIEVGVDVPNATVVIVEDADRFGLAQLHQLRGRVGRAHYKSYCFLLGQPTTAEAARRLEILTSTNDGFRIAEQDLMLRGPGEFLGTAQSGIPPLRVAHLTRDADLLDHTRAVATEILNADPLLERPENSPLLFLLGEKPHSVPI